MTDIYWPYPDSPASSCSSAVSFSSSEMSVSPAPSPRQEPEPTPTPSPEWPTPTETATATTTPTAASAEDDAAAEERLDNAACRLSAGVHYPPNPYRRSEPYRPASPGGWPAAVRRRRAADPADTDPAERRRFQRAVNGGDCDAVRRMLTAGARVGLNRMDANGWTALHRAVRRGQLELVRLLVGHGADFRLADRDGFSPVHMASWGGHSHVVVYLLGLQR